MLIQLASQSPRRRELLSQIGVRYKTITVNVPEQHSPGESAQDYVQRLAVSKADAGFKLSPSYPTLGADTIVCCGSKILEKPSNFAECVEMLSLLSGRDHQVMTSVCMIATAKKRLATSISTVSFRVISSEQMREYWASGEPQDKAGGYAIQGLGAVFVEKIAGSYSGIVGLPIEIVSEMLSDFGVPMWEQSKE